MNADLSLSIRTEKADLDNGRILFVCKNLTLPMSLDADDGLFIDLEERQLL